MGKPTIGCILGLVLLSLTGPTSLDAKIRIKYEEARSHQLIEVQGLLIKQRVLENIATALENNRLQLLNSLTFTTAQCGAVNFFYTRNTKTITMCYEMIQYLLKQIGKDKKLQNLNSKRTVFNGAIGFLLLHEVGHALIDLYNLQIVGREEDVADQMALLDTFEAPSATPQLQDTIFIGALWLLLNIDESELSEKDFRNEHAMGKQRYYNVMCWAYGKDSIRFVDFKDQLQDRAPRCKDEYEKGLAGVKALWQPIVAQGPSTFPPFQVQVNQVYTHPSNSLFGITFDGQSLMAVLQPTGLLDMWTLDMIPQGQWNTLMVSYNQQQLPVMVMRHGYSLMARWVP
jgi:hypothetical protein